VFLGIKQPRPAATDRGLAKRGTGMTLAAVFKYSTNVLFLSGSGYRKGGSLGDLKRVRRV
jgi:hypothetical protein